MQISLSTSVPQGPGSGSATHSFLAPLLAGEAFWPPEPRTVEETGLDLPFLEGLCLKILAKSGRRTGRSVSDSMCIPHAVVEPLLSGLKSRQLIVHAGSAAFGDYFYSPTEEGRRQSSAHVEACAYSGAAPVPFSDYVVSIEAQAISDVAICRDELEDAFAGISVPRDLFDLLGPAINSGSGMFLYGAPGNGKSTLARRITACFGQSVWIPRAILDDECLVKLYDPAYHNEIGESDETGFDVPHDRRWVRIRRPTVIVGGELRMEDLEIGHSATANICEAPLQMKSNCGCLLIDDFGRQRISPQELLNRWIIPLENRVDYLTLPTGKKMPVPFEQLVIFSTNLEPKDLVDEAFLRRLPYKIEISDPTNEEFHYLFELACDQVGCEFSPDTVEYVLEHHYENARPRRRCHPRDLLAQVRNFCRYNDLPVEMRPDYFDHIAEGFFTAVVPTQLETSAARLTGTL